MEGSYERINKAMQESNIMKNYGKYLKIPDQMNSLFEWITRYWSTICQYNNLTILDNHKFDSRIPRFTDPGTTHIWGSYLYGVMLNFYKKRGGKHRRKVGERFSEEDFSSNYLGCLADEKRLIKELGEIPQETKIGLINLAKDSKVVDLKYKQRQKELELYKNFIRVIKDNLTLRLKSVEESVDAVLTEHATSIIVEALSGESEEDAMHLNLYIGLRLRPDMAGENVRKDTDGSFPLFEKACKRSLTDAENGIIDIFRKYAEASGLEGWDYKTGTDEFMKRLEEAQKEVGQKRVERTIEDKEIELKNRIQFWKNWVKEWEKADEHISRSANELQNMLINQPAIVSNC